MILTVTVLVSNILLQTKLQRLEEKSRSVEEVGYMFRKIFWIPSFLSFLLIGYWILPKDDIAKTILLGLLFALVQNSVPLYYIVKLPKLKEFTLNQWKELRKNQVGPD